MKGVNLGIKIAFRRLFGMTKETDWVAFTHHNL